MARYVKIVVRDGFWTVWTHNNRYLPPTHDHITRVFLLKRVVLR